MSINLEKRVKNVKIQLEKIQFGENIQVAVALDISGSMSSTFQNGTVQDLVERLLAIGINLDRNQKIEVFPFNGNAYTTAPATRRTLENYVEERILDRLSIGGGIKYAPVMQEISNRFKMEHVTRTVEVKQKKRFLSSIFGTKEVEEQKETYTTGDPLVVFFITDGANSDRDQTEALIKKLSNRPVFWQFIGINSPWGGFPFLEKLDDLHGRYIDNANFFNAGDIASIDDNDLYKRILNEMPQWYKKAKELGVIK